MLSVVLMDVISLSVLAPRHRLKNHKKLIFLSMLNLRTDHHIPNERKRPIEFSRNIIFIGKAGTIKLFTVILILLDN